MITPDADKTTTVVAVLRARPSSSSVASAAVPAPPAAAAPAKVPAPMPVVAAVPRGAAKGTRIVPPSSVSKVAGSLPKLEAKNLPEATGMSVRLCIDEAGAVTSSHINTALPAEIAGKLTASFATWRYRPYQDGGRAVPVCFAVIFSLRSNPR